MAKEIVQIDAQTGATVKKSHDIMQGGDSFTPFLTVVAGFSGSVLGMLPSGGMEVFDPSYFFGWVAGGTAFGLSVARYLMVHDFLDSYRSSFHADFETTLWQKVKIALYLPVKVKGDNKYHRGIQYLSDRHYYDSFANPSDAPHKFGSVYKAEINVHPFHYTTKEEWEKTQIGLWDDIMDAALKSEAYMVNNKPVNSLRSLMY